MYILHASSMTCESITS